VKGGGGEKLRKKGLWRKHGVFVVLEIWKGTRMGGCREANGKRGKKKEQ